VSTPPCADLFITPGLLLPPIDESQIHAEIRPFYFRHRSCSCWFRSSLVGCCWELRMSDTSGRCNSATQHPLSVELSTPQPVYENSTSIARRVGPFSDRYQYKRRSLLDGLAFAFILDVDTPPIIGDIDGRLPQTVALPRRSTCYSACNCFTGHSPGPQLPTVSQRHTRSHPISPGLL